MHQGRSYLRAAQHFHGFTCPYGTDGKQKPGLDLEAYGYSLALDKWGVVSSPVSTTGVRLVRRNYPSSYGEKVVHKLCHAQSSYPSNG